MCLAARVRGMDLIDDDSPSSLESLDLAGGPQVNSRKRSTGGPKYDSASPLIGSIFSDRPSKGKLKASDSFEIELPAYVAGDGYEEIVGVDDLGKNVMATPRSTRIPVGLVFGTLPFMLKSAAKQGGSDGTYANIGMFSLATLPYSLKLLWSPIVDAVYSHRIGRRKSWIIPIQLVVGVLLIGISYHIGALLSPPLSIVKITLAFSFLILLCATQDIAVDGWALTLLDREHIQFSSTCQAVGLNAGYFLSFTVFLALNSSAFCNRYLRKEPLETGILHIDTFLRICGLLFLFITLAVLRMKPEKGSLAPRISGLVDAYKTIIKIGRLENIKILASLLVIGKLGFIVNEVLTPLKLVELGFPKESLALAILIDFGIQICLSFFAVKMASGSHPLKPWQLGCLMKTGMTVIGMLLVASFPVDGVVSNRYFAFVMAYTIVTSFSSTIMSVSLSAYFSMISDPAVGGTYMSFLNTFSNLGGTWPKFLALYAVDLFTSHLCTGLLPGAPLPEAFDDRCLTPQSIEDCLRLGGTCQVRSDGYYKVNFASLVLGLLVARLLIRPIVKRLEQEPHMAWKIS